MPLCETAVAQRLAGTVIKFLPKMPRYEPPRSVRLQQLDGLRGIAMLFVFMGHFSTLWAPLVPPQGAAHAFLHLIQADATLGSSFFMLLSGYFSYSTLLQGRKGFRDFLQGRICRLYPLYFLVSCLYIAGSLLIPGMSRLPLRPLDAIGFIVANLLFLPGVFPFPLLMEVAWTLSFIVLFYFVAGAFTQLVRLCRLARVERIVFLLAAAAVWALLGNYAGWWPVRTNILWVGMALAEAVDAMSGNRTGLATRLVAPATTLALLGVLLRTALMMSMPDTGRIPIELLRNVFTVTALFAFSWVAHFGPEWWKRLLSTSLLRQLGAASYSFYLTHGITLKIFRFAVIPWLGTVAAQPAAFWVCQILGLVISVTIARIVFEFVENPLAVRVKAIFVRPATVHLPGTLRRVPGYVA